MKTAAHFKHRLLNLSLASVLSAGLVAAEFTAILAHPVTAEETTKPAPMQGTKDTFKQLSGKLRTFDIHSVLYDRFQSYGKEPFSAPDGAIYKEILSPRHQKASLLTLLKDKDAKVRTLAIAALYNREDPSILPELVTLADDKSQTYPEPVPVARAYNSASEMPTRDNTVGEVARAVVKFYMEPAGYYYGIAGSGSNPGFKQYFETHGQRKYCASWFRVKLKRACTGCSPTDKSRITKIREVRKQIDSIAEPDRYWTLLWLQDEAGSDVLASQEDLVQAMKKLGPDRLMQMLQCKIQTDDPDLRPRSNNNYPYTNMQLSVLKQASSVLLPGQADALLACDKWERDYQANHRSDPLITPWWAIAAASLTPKKASALLHGEFARLDHDFYGFQKADLAAALFKQCGLSETKFLLDDFYRPDSFYKNKQYSQFRPLFIKAIADDPQAGKFFSALVKDPRFSNLNDASALQKLAELLPSITTKQLTLSDSTAHLWHPMGLDSACCHLDEAAQKYPKETDEMLKVMKAMREALRQAINQA